MTPTMTAVRPRLTLRPRSTRPWFRLDRHAVGVRSNLPAAIQAMLQNGTLDRVFRDSLVPQFLFPQVADAEPWMGGLGDSKIFTRKGLLAPATTPVTGSDPSASTYTIEQWSVVMDQYANSMDTNMLGSSLALASKYLADVENLGINAGQTINQVARNKLYKAYSGGRTWCTTAGSSDTSIIVQSTNGFETVLVNGVPTAVSASNPLTVNIAGTANTVTGVNTGTSTLTLGTARVDVAGDYVVAANAPTTIRATGNSAYDLSSSNTVTFANFRSAVARLRKMAVPTVGGYYVAHIDPDTEAELFADSDFKQALQGRVDSPIYRDLSIGRFAGIDWVRNLEAPTILGGSAGTLTVHRPVVLGANALMSAPLDGTANLLAGTGVEDVPDIRTIPASPGVDVTLLVRPPQDRLQQVVTTTWAWTGDFGVPSDAGSGDAALFKRGVVIEHA
jgi:N4-gp56 family major capsid protein